MKKIQIYNCKWTKVFCKALPARVSYVLNKLNECLKQKNIQVKQFLKIETFSLFFLIVE